jgi:hypothetical protein
MLSDMFSVVLRPSIRIGSGLQNYPLRDIEGVIDLDSKITDSAFPASCGRGAVALGASCRSCDRSGRPSYAALITRRARDRDDPSHGRGRYRARGVDAFDRPRVAVWCSYRCSSLIK